MARWIQITLGALVAGGTLLFVIVDGLKQRGYDLNCETLKMLSGCIGLVGLTMFGICLMVQGICRDK